MTKCRFNTLEIGSSVSDVKKPEREKQLITFPETLRTHPDPLSSPHTSITEQEDRFTITGRPSDTGPPPWSEPLRFLHHSQHTVIQYVNYSPLILATVLLHYITERVGKSFHSLLPPSAQVDTNLQLSQLEGIEQTSFKVQLHTHVGMLQSPEHVNEEELQSVRGCVGLYYISSIPFLFKSPLFSQMSGLNQVGEGCKYSSSSSVDHVWTPEQFDSG